MTGRSRPVRFVLAALLAAALALLTTVAPASAAAPPAPPLQALLQDLVDAGATGALALVDDGAGVRRYAAGQARLQPATELRPEARFRAGS